MTAVMLCDHLQRLLNYFRTTLPAGVKPRIIFHGSEPMPAREAVFAGIEKYRQDFHFGVQTNATLLDEEAIVFLTAYEVGIGISEKYFQMVRYYGWYSSRSRGERNKAGTFRPGDEPPHGDSAHDVTVLDVIRLSAPAHRFKDLERTHQKDLGSGPALVSSMRP